MSQMREVRAPSEQEGTSSRLLRWLKKPGEAVAENEPLIEIETDKVTVEVAAPANGVLDQLLKQEGEELTPGELLGYIGCGGSAAVAVPPQTRHGLSKEISLPTDPPSQQGLSQTAPAHPSPLSPAVRRLLVDHGIPAASVRGTGLGGRITVGDVLREAADRGARDIQTEPSDKGHLVAHSAVRLRIAERMVQSLLRTAPHVTSVFEADLSAVIAHRARHREDFERRGVSLTFTAYFLAAAVEAIRAVPQANSRWTDSALELYDNIDIGVATAAEQGLVVPILRNVESLDLFEIARGLNELATRAREGKLTPADVRGGTFTISNHGVSGSLMAAPIVINQPQSAILGVGKVEKRVVVMEKNGEDEIVVRPRCFVTLTIDHRVMDGVQANRFLQTLIGALGRATR